MTTGVRLLGTGGADGWPSAFCRCASCTAERAAGRSRAQTAALVDGTVLVDCGPMTAHVATQHGVDLAGVRLLLWTHQHSDHFSPATLMHRSWVADGPLTVLGPPDVIAAARPWLAEGTEVEFVAVRPGEVVERAGCVVRVLAAAHGTGLGDPGEAEAVLYDLTSPSGLRILHAADTGPLPAATVAAAADASYDVVLLEESFGDWTEHGREHLDLVTFPEQVRRLREVGAIGDATDVVAVHLSHHNPPTPELIRRLAAWGARVVDDGTLLAAGSRPATPPVLRTLVLGGARSGKSREAERLLADAARVDYVATGYPADSDPEWAARVRAHQRQRPGHWKTVETLDLAGLLAEEGAPLLVDCLTLWLTRVMDWHDAWDDHAWDTGAAEAVEAECAALVAAWRRTSRRVVAVSNEVGQGVVPDSAAGRRFRDLMGRLNARVAAETEDVLWCVAGRVTSL